MSIRVIVVEDDEDLREETVFGLCVGGVEATGVSDAPALYRELIREPADIVVLDVGLPGESGIEIAKYMKAAQPTRVSGIIMLTGHGGVEDRVAGLQSGADIYLVKPIHPEELAAYVKSLYRRMQTGSVGPSHNVAWRLSVSQWRLTCPSGANTILSHHESVVLELLTRNAGRVVTRREIIAKALNQDPMTYDDRRLEAIVSRLRKKLHQLQPLSQPLKAAHGSGYIFTEPIEFDAA